MQNQFNEKFDEFVCVGDTISADVEGFTVTASIVFDEGYGIDDDDCHNPDQAVTGCDDEQQTRLLAARKAWFDGEWFYCGVVLSVSKNGITLDSHGASLWGIECNYPGSGNSDLTEVANELLPGALEQAKATLKSLCE